MRATRTINPIALTRTVATASIGEASFSSFSPPTRARADAEDQGKEQHLQ